MGIAASEKQMKDAFRTAYSFLEKHNTTLGKPEEYQAVVRDIASEYVKCGGDNLTTRLIMAVYDYICDVSKGDAN